MRTLMLVALVLLAGAARATTPTPVENMADPLRHPYQQFGTSGTCQLQGDCAILLPATTNNRTVITHLSCFFFLASGGSVEWAKLSTSASSANNFVPIFNYAAANGDIDFGINAETYLFFDKGDQPRIDVFSQGAPVQNLECTASGYVL